jgi:hypothetical protein
MSVQGESRVGRVLLGAEGAVGASTGGGFITISWPPSTWPNKYQLVANIGGTQTTIGEFVIPNSQFAGRLPVLVNTSSGPFMVAGSGAEMRMAGSIALFSQAAHGVSAYDAATTEILGSAGTIVSVEKAEIGAGA